MRITVAGRLGDGARDRLAFVAAKIGHMIFAGIDLAADPARTGIATLEAAGEELLLLDVSLNASDPTTASRIRASERTGIDVPLGWPRAFREVIALHAVRTLEPQEGGAEWRRGLVNRFTDLEARRIAGVVPLPVAAERIAYPALRWAAIEARLRADGMDAAELDRAGGGSRRCIRRRR
ncbi:DUF429 domain-containing protein [Corynebacterium jeddahense]|nr:DUF429 domain-containing protein [Corynebacterium jeddahense]